jgi:superfamily II DNA/RNA helicase
MKFEKLISISGQGSLFETVSRTKFGLIAESLETNKRVPVYANTPVSALQDISLYTEEGDKPIREVFLAMLNQSNAQSAPDAKDSTDELRAFLAAAVPNYDKDKVHDTDVRKLCRWYNQLLKHGLSAADLESSEATDENATPEAKAPKAKDSATKAPAKTRSKAAKPVSNAPARKPATVRKSS